MDFNNKQIDPGAAAQNIMEGGKGLADKFRELPKNIQVGVLVGVAFVLFLIIRGGGESEAVKPEVVVVSVEAENKPGAIRENIRVEGEGDDNFGAVDVSRESLISGFVGQQELSLANMKQDMEKYIADKETQIVTLQQDIIQRNSEFQQMMEGFQAQIAAMEESNSSYREEIARIAEDARRQSLQTSQVGDVPSQVQSARKTRISQTTLSRGDSGVRSNADQALLNVDLTKGNSSVRRAKAQGGVIIPEEPQPFIPPLGFVRGTLLNGVDALAGGGQATPALVRLSGSYKTAMNSTVSLNGCFMLVEFEGNISTERAQGKPSRMTCVYPDQGAVTYSVTGYVVDAKDGVIGVPGVFYEGDAARLAAALVAEFAAGMASVIKESQFDIRDSGATGDKTTLLTGDDVKAGLTGGLDSSASQLSEYLLERANRIVPFVRIDSTREINLVLLSGVTLRDTGKPWTLLFDGERADKDAATLEQGDEQGNNK